MKKGFSISHTSTLGNLFHKVTSKVIDRNRKKAISYGNVYVALVFAILGILLVTQFRTQASVTRQLRAQREEDLGQIVRDLNQEKEALRQQVADLTVQLFRYSQAAEDKKAILIQAAENLRNLEAASGLTKVTGKGIILIIHDQKEFLNNYDLLDIVQELRAAGAEAISIENQRLIGSTSIGESKGVVTIDNIPIKPPYEIKAIGNPEILEQAVTILGGIRDTFTSFEGVSLEITQSQVIIPAVKKKPSFEVAKPLKKSS